MNLVRRMVHNEALLDSMFAIGFFALNCSPLLIACLAPVSLMFIRESVSRPVALTLGTIGILFVGFTFAFHFEMNWIARFVSQLVFLFAGFLVASYLIP